MSLSHNRRTRLIAALSLLLWVHGANSQGTPSAVGTYRIAGHVLSAADGHPLPRASVSIAVSQGGTLVSSLTTGDDGAFSFEGVASGKYSLFGMRRGFIPSAYRGHELYSTAIVTGAGIDTENLDLQLEPEASIIGRVLDESGDPIPSAQVSLYAEKQDTGKKLINTYSSTQTNALGDYVFAQLPAGNYFVSVRAEPWYAVPSSPGDPQALFPDGIDATLDVAYPLTFYGDTIKQEAALPIPLKAGKRTRADVHLSPVRAVRFKTGTRPGEPASIVFSLKTPVFDGFEDISVSAQTNSAGENEVVGLAPRKYEFETAAQAPDGTSYSGVVDLTQGSAEADPRRAIAEGSMTLSLVQEDGSKLPLQSSIMLRGSRPLSNNRQEIAADGTVTFSNLPPDDYHFSVYGGNTVWQTLRIEDGDKQLAQDHRALEAGEAANLKLFVAGTAKAVEGTAVREGKPMASAMIVLAPVDALDNPDLFRRDQSDLDGTFALMGVPAGRYIVVAIDDGWKLEWGKPEILTRFLLKGMPVAVPVTQREPFRLPGPVTVQER